jgi:glycosyltransferase involved in cell wall biosynthesis
MRGVSFVVPVHNGAATIRETLQAIVHEAVGLTTEIIVVDDCGSDGSSRLLVELAREWPLRIIRGARRGAAAAINTGIRAARFSIVCQIDQDVVVGPGWLGHVIAGFENSDIAAVQGYYVTDPTASLCVRAMSLDLEQRYAAIESDETDHVCTGNVGYRAEALRQVGLFDESLGYGYDNDMSYRLVAAGYRLTMCRQAQSRHRWREGPLGYLEQQYGFGYGRLDVVAKHRHRYGGDSVSPRAMMAHPLLMALALFSFVLGAIESLAGNDWQPFVFGGATLLAGLAIERILAGVRAVRQFGDPAALIFPVLHLARDVAWVAAMATWLFRRLCGQPSTPAHSMRPRRSAPSAAHLTVSPSGAGRHEEPRVCRILCIVPAHNEAANLAAVVAEIRACRPDFDLLIVDDGSTDDTTGILEELGVRWLRFPERMGIGSAMRAGLRYAARARYDFVVRMDGDGQHRASDLEGLLAPLQWGVDVVLGSRYSEPSSQPAGVFRSACQKLLAVCLSELTGKRVTDPTSGFCALGPRAVRLLAEHHPTGYPEPELRLFLSRNAVTAVEAPVRRRSRFEGKTSLTPFRLAAASARVLLAMIVVPLRCRVEVTSD